MELKTTIQEQNGSYYIRIPANMVEYFKVQKTKEAKIKDLSEKQAVITFPLW